MNRALIITLLFPFLTSCFKEDEPIKPGNKEIFKVSESIYTHLTYFDLSTRKIVSVIPSDAWDIGFESADTGWHIIINSGKYIGIYSSGTSDFDGLKTVPATARWKYDKSDGDPDSTAVGNWLSPESGNPTNEVYVVGINDGIKYEPFKKIVFMSLTSGVYSFRYADIDGSSPGSFSLTKDASKNFVYFSFSEGGKEVSAEPEKNSWDFVFRQYSTTLYTDEGIATPYLVRGVLINPNGVTAALDTLIGYTGLRGSDIQDLKFSRGSDVIGHDWKSVEIEGTTATYAVRPKNTYVIRDTGGLFFKLRFTGFFNDSGAPGYPGFEFGELF
jgi:hypothetical protein